MNISANDLSDIEENFFPQYCQEEPIKLTEKNCQIDEIEPAWQTQTKRTRTSPGYFHYLQYKNGNDVKKEYLRCQLIRGHNRLIKNALARKLPRKTLNKIRKTNTSQMEKWKIFKSFSELNIKPRFQIKDYQLPNYKSFNNKNCYQYFSDPTLRQSFFLYCDVVLIDEDTDDLCEKFNMFCCLEESEHSKICQGKWNKIKQFIRKEMISELCIGEC